MRRWISWNTAHQLRSVLSGWYRQRTTSRPSSLDDSMFLFHGILDHTITLSQLGECGIDIASYRPWTELQYLLIILMLMMLGEVQQDHGPFGGYRSVAVVPTSCSYPGHHHRINTTTTIISIIRNTTIIQPISA